MCSEDHPNGSIAGDSGSSHSDGGDHHNDISETEFNRSSESEVFPTSDGHNPPCSRISPMLSAENLPMPLTSSPDHFNTGSLVSIMDCNAKFNTALSPPKISSRSSSPRMKESDKCNPQPKILRGSSPTEVDHSNGDKQTNEETLEQSVISKLSPPSTKLHSPKCKMNEISTETPENNDKDVCTCWRKPLIDQIFITDVTSNLVTVTVRECFTDKGFFRKRS